MQTALAATTPLGYNTSTRQNMVCGVLNGNIVAFIKYRCERDLTSKACF
jgi:hypothetical protein